MAYTINNGQAAQAKSLTITGLNTPNTITLGNLSAGLTFNPTLEKAQQHFKKYEIIESDEDLLVLSCALHRIRSTPNLEKGYCMVSGSLMLNDYTYQQVNYEDRELANKIRSFYNQKFMVMTLKEHKFTRYREDLNRFLQGDGKKFIERDIGMVYYLPQFYAYDQKFIELKDKFAQSDKLKSRQIVDISLYPVDVMLRSTKLHKTKMYWFKDIDNLPYLYKVPTHNPLLPFMDREFFNKEKIDLTCCLYPKNYDGDFSYYEITKINKI